MMAATLYDAEREPWTRVGRQDPCEACGKPDWCMTTATTVMCMRVREGSYHTGRNSRGEEYYLHRRTGVPLRARPPRRDEPASWTRPAPLTYTALYHELIAHMTRPAPPEAQAADARRFGEHAPAIAAVEDAVYLRPPAEVLAWLRTHGRMPDAFAAGVVYHDERHDQDRLAGALVDTKVHVYRERGQVRNLKGRKLDPAAKVKALSLYGTREERGCEHVLYQHDQLARATDGLLVIAGGPAKVDACLAAGFHAVGGEETLSDAQIAAIAAARPAGIVVFADGEDAPAPGELSPGQGHALAMGERLEELGAQAVRITEPEREPGSPKVDADSLLRDHGPEALRALVRSAVPLAVYRRKVGAEPSGASLSRLVELERENAGLAVALERCGAESARKDARIRELGREVDALEAAIKHPDQAAGIGALDIVDAATEAYQRGEVLTRDGKDYARIPYTKAAKRRAAKTVARGLKSLTGTDLREKLPREPVAFGHGQVFAAFAHPEPIETKTFKGEVDIAYVFVPEELRGQRGKAVLGILPTYAEPKKHGGRRTIEVPAEVAAQSHPVRREREQVIRWYDALSDAKLTTEYIPLGTDYWTAEGEQRTREEVEALRVDAGYQPGRVPSYRPVASPEQAPLRIVPEPRQDADREPLGTSRQDAEVFAGGYPDGCPDCGAPIVIGGYCEAHFAARRDAHRRHHPDGWDESLAVGGVRPPGAPPASVRLCLSAARGCRNRVDPGEDYCAACARRGYVNAPAPAYAAGD